MFKKLFSVLIAIIFIINIFPNVSFSATLSYKIDGQKNILKPVDGSYTKVKYNLIDSNGQYINDENIIWSSSEEIIILPGGYVLLGQDTPLGTYTISAQVNGVVCENFQITVKSGSYLTNTYSSGSLNLVSEPFFGDCNIEFEFCAPSASNSAAFYMELLKNDSNWHFPFYLRSHATNYKLRFDNYSGDGNTNLRDEYTSSIPYNYTPWPSIRIDTRYDADIDYISSYDVYLNDTLLDIFTDCVPMPKDERAYRGIQKLYIRNTISMKNIKVYSGEVIDITDEEYKYLGLSIYGETDFSTPRTATPISSQYDIINKFGLSVNSDASWSINPENSGVEITADGMLKIGNNAQTGIYTVSAEVNNSIYSKTISVSDIDYVLSIVGTSEFIRDHVIKNGEITLEAYDNFNIKANASWYIKEENSAIELSVTSDGNCILTIGENVEDGTYTVCAEALPSENFDIDTSEMKVGIFTAEYSIAGNDSIVKPENGYNAVEYKLTSEINNDVETGVVWSCNDAEVLDDGRLLICKETPGSVKLTAKYNGNEFNKILNVTAGNVSSGIPYERSLTYKGTNYMSVSDDVSEKYLFANAIEDGVSNPLAQIEWNIVRLSDELHGSASKITINESKLCVNGKLFGKIYISGKIKNTLTTTGEIEITLTESFSTLDGNTININDSDNEPINIKHYKPMTGDYIDAVLDYSTEFREYSYNVPSDGSLTVDLSFTDTGMHYVVVENSMGLCDEYIIFVNENKLFEQTDVQALLLNDRINEYLLLYSGESREVIVKSSDIYSALPPEWQDAVVKLSDKDYIGFFASVFLVDFINSHNENVELLKSKLSKLNIDTKFVDLFMIDNLKEEIASKSLNYTQSLATFIDFINGEIVLNGIAASSKNNTREAKAYLAIANSETYNKVSETHKNAIADYVAGNKYLSLQQLYSAIDSVSLKPSSPSGGGSSSFGKTQTGSIGSVVSAQTTQTESLNNNDSKIEFSDVKPDYWSYAYIESLSNMGIISGYDDGSFLPENNITRAEFVKLLVVAYDMELSNDICFDDVHPDDWFSPYISVAYSNGLIKGNGKSFYPNDVITRQDAAVVIYNFMKMHNDKFQSLNLNFKDESDISDYARDAVGALTDAGIFNGMPDGSFLPHNGTTRAQTAKLVYTIISRGGSI